MVNHGMVLSALGAVTDPELHYDIVTLNMVRNIAIQGGEVTVDVALTVAGCPLHQRIEQDVTQAVEKLPGVSSVQVRLDVMNDEERRNAFARAFQKSQGQKASAPEAQRPPGREGNLWSPMLGESSETVVLGIASGKGGVGKSTVTANLAVALERLGFRVGVMDMDIYGYSQGRMLGAHGQARANQEQKIIPWNAQGVHVVSMGMFVPDNQAVVWRGPMLGKMMQQFFTDVAWPELDYLLIDLPPGTGDVALDVAQRLPKASLVIVTTPQVVAREVAMRTADVAQRAQQRVLGIIENMSYIPMGGGERMEVFGRGGGEELSKQLDVPLLGQIPLESSVREGGDRGTPVLLSAPDSEAAITFLQVAQKIHAAAHA
ncbi:P-loop NTPase [Sulfobacillus harzensis]|uniref:Iron-sulfur cluster carrier protein n=1 Tax=Sulfobacillus harzensis TaxID=2729629 RepID=A0A7Y0Q182_9FIRM|nr:P-loop NTPase [Sulfobacillus harzensis]NMP21050.1 P-loop NTPase [Sulfobacillus harzensis]